MASIRKRVLPSGKTSWQADYRDSKGARRSRQFATRRDADAFLLKARTEVSQGKHTPDSTSITVSQAADLWLRKSQADGLQFSTVKSYSEIVNLHIVPLIGTEKLSRLTTAAVENFKDKLI